MAFAKRRVSLSSVGENVLGAAWHGLLPPEFTPQALRSFAATRRAAASEMLLSLSWRTKRGAVITTFRRPSTLVQALAQVAYYGRQFYAGRLARILR